MLPDLRVLFFATVSTFLVAICAAFFVSVHVLPDPLTVTQADRSTPISRVSASWQDVSRPATRDVSPAALRPNDIPLPRAKADETPPESKAAPGGESAVAKTPAPDADAATTLPQGQASGNAPKEPEEDMPAATGSISDVPSTLPAPDKQQLAARPDQTEAAERGAAAPQAAAPVLPAVAPKAKVTRKHRVVRRGYYDATPSASLNTGDPNYNFFTDFGSRIR